MIASNNFITQNLRKSNWSGLNIQYSQRHSVVNHRDRRITLLSDTEITFGLFDLFTDFLMPFG